MHKFLIAVGAVLALLVAAILVGPSLVDWNTQKDRIVAEVQKATGRDFSIQGDMSLSLLPVPALSAQGVRLASVEGGSAAPMVELKELRVRVALLPLLQGTVQVERILLVEPKILLEVLPDGRRNWAFADGSAGAEGTIGPGASDFDIRFDDVSIEKGTLTYRDARTGRDERIDELNLRIVAESLQGPFAAKGRLQTHGIAGFFEGTVGRLVDEGATPYNFVVKPAGETARLQLSGAISSHPDTLAINGHLKGEGKNLARLIEDLTGGAGPWPEALAQDFAIQGELSVDRRSVSISALSLELGGFRFAGEVTSLLAPPYDARLILAASQLDLDQGFEPAKQKSGTDGQAATANGDGAPRQAWVLPADASARLELSVDALIYRGQLIRQLRFDAALNDGELQLERAIALLPGSSDISLTGSLREAEGAAEFDGRLEAASDNLRGLLQWVGADVSAVPPDRLRRLSLTSRVTGSPKQISLDDLDLRMDQTRVSGGLVIAPRKRPGFGVGLALDSINLDAYLPGAAAGADGTAGSMQQQDGAEEPAAAAGSALLDRFDANLNLRAGAVTLRGAVVKDLQVDATLQNGVLEFRTARVGNLNGGEITYVGRVDKIATSPALDGNLKLSVSEPMRLAPLLGLEPEALVRMPAFTGEGQITGGLEKLDVDAQISGGGGRLGVAGTLQPAAAPLAFDLRLTGRHPDLAALLEMAGRPLPSETDLGVLDLALHVAGDPGRFRISELKGALGPANLSGGFAVTLAGAHPALSDLNVQIDAKHPDAGQLARVAGLLSRPIGGLGALDLRARLNGGSTVARLDDLEASVGPLRLSGTVGLSLDGLSARLGSYDLRVAAKDPDLARLAADLGWDPAMGDAMGGLDLTARVRGDRSRMQVEDLEGRLGPVDLSGRLSADLGGARPAVAADLATGDLPLDLLLGSAAGQGTSDGGESNGARWSRDAIDLAGLRSFDARVNLRSAALTHDKLRMEQVDLSANLKAGRLDLERLTGTVHGGTLRVVGRVDLRDEIAAGLRVTAIEVDLGELLRAQAGLEQISGPVYFNGDFTTRGLSEADLVSGLEGTAELSGLLTFEARPDQEPDAAPAGEQGEPDLTGLLSRALGRDPVRLAGTIKAEAGRLRTEDTRLDGQPAYALTEATVDLPGWTLEGVTDIYERSTGQPLISSLAYGGPLDALALERAELPPGPVPDTEEPGPSPRPEEPSQAPQSDGPSPAPEPQEPAAPAAPAVSGPIEPEPGPAAPAAGDEPAAAPSQPQTAAPVPKPAPKPDPKPGPKPDPKPDPKPAVPTTPQPDDLLKDLLKLGG